MEPLADISYERATWAFFLVLLACVLAGKVGLCLGNLFWQKKTIKHVSEDTFSDHASNGKGRKTAIASPKVSWGLKVIYKDLEDITRWREDMYFIFEWQNNILRIRAYEWVKYCFCHEKIKFISSRRRVHVRFFLLYRQKDIDKIIEGIRNYRNR